MRTKMDHPKYLYELKASWIKGTPTDNQISLFLDKHCHFLKNDNLI